MCSQYRHVVDTCIICVGVYQADKMKVQVVMRMLW